MIATLSLALLITAAPAPEVEGECSPRCRDGYVCREGSCISACNPACEDDERCTTAGGFAQCVAEKDATSERAVVAPEEDGGFTEASDGVGVCRPACDAGESCLRTSSGYRCLGRSGSYAGAYPGSTPRNYGRSSRVRYRDSAKAPAITLGVLSVLGGVLSFVAAGVAASDTTTTGSDSTVAILALGGVLNLSLGLWGIIGGANAGYVDEDGRRR